MAALKVPSEILRERKANLVDDLICMFPIEEAFQIPYHMLKIKQALYREMLTAAERDV